MDTVTEHNSIRADGPQALLRLMAWLSPAFPVGSFAYSGGLERAVADGLVGNGAGLSDWVRTSLRHGAAHTDGVFLALAHGAQADARALADLSELALALAGSRERHDETLGLGAAFARAVGAWPNTVLARLPSPIAYPVAVGAVAGAHGVPVDLALIAFLQAYVAQVGSAGIRLGVVGQTGAVALQAETEDMLRELAERLSRAGLDDLGSATIAMEIVALKHETQGTRLFRS